MEYGSMPRRFSRLGSRQPTRLRKTPTSPLWLLTFPARRRPQRPLPHTCLRVIGSAGHRLFLESWVWTGGGVAGRTVGGCRLSEVVGQLPECRAFWNRFDQPNGPPTYPGPWGFWGG